MKRLQKGLSLTLRFLLCVFWLLLTTSLVWPWVIPFWDNSPAARPPLPTGVNYVVVAPAGLAESAAAWAQYRQQKGYQSEMALFEPAEMQVETIQTYLQERYEASGRPHPFYVLLLGQAQNAQAVESYLPAVRLPLHLPQMYIEAIGFDTVVSDDAFGFDAEQNLLPISFGRVPAHTNEEALRVLARTQNYEERPPAGFNRLQVELIASESLFGPVFDVIIEWLIIFYVEQYLPQYYRWHVFYGHAGSAYAYPVEQFPAGVANRLNQSSILTSYIGHGNNDYLGPAHNTNGNKGPIFTPADLPLVDSARGTIMVMLACSAGAYDENGSLAEQLLLQPGGPVATYAASRFTLPTTNTVLGKDVYHMVLTGQAPTLGENIRLAEANYENPGSDKAFSLWVIPRLISPIYGLSIQDNPDEALPIHPNQALDANSVYKFQQHTYNLFGDPALAVAVPRPELEIAPRWLWQPFGSQMSFTGRGELPEGQKMQVWLFSRQGEIFPIADSVTDLAQRHQQANHKTAGQVVVTTAADGSFAGEIPLPDDLPAGHYILQVVTTSGTETLVGTQTVYVGWAAVFELLTLPTFWWLLLTIGFSYQIISKLRRKV